MTARRSFCLAAAGLLAAPALRAQTPLQIGLAPFLTPTTMLSAFRPLREHLARQLQLPVELYTARDFVDLVVQTRQRAYELSFLPSHLAGLAISDWGFAPLAGTLGRAPVLLVVRSSNAALRSPNELRGKRIAALGQLSLSAAVGTLWLRQRKLLPGRDVTLVPQPSINNAMLELARGDVDAVFATRNQIDMLPPDGLASYRVMAEVGELEAPLFIAQPGTGAARLSQLRQALLSFQPDPGLPVSVGNTTLYNIDQTVLGRLDALREAAIEQLREAGVPSERPR